VFRLIRLQADPAAGLARHNAAQQDALQRAVRELEFQAAAKRSPTRTSQAGS
jgi:hypothetical protein